jgi:hypothetical protein
MRPHQKNTIEEYNRRWLATRFAKTVKTENGCWIWQGFITANGYAQSSWKNKTGHVHRRVYIILHGELPSSIDVCHTCDVRLCINPDHLWAGTRKQNVKDMTAKRRHYNTVKTVCLRGHSLTPENVWLCKRGMRHCRECSRLRQRKDSGWRAMRRRGRKRDEPGWTYSSANTPASA